MNYIATWLCADQKGEESLFPQSGELSSSQKHLDVYWRCIVVFYLTSRRFNTDEKHLFFTNLKELPELDGMDMRKFFEEQEVQVIHTDFRYKTPKGYFATFQNQFYEFSILEYISNHNYKNEDQILVLDSDCVFLKSAADLFKAAEPQGFISFHDPVKPDYVINGLSRNDMKRLYEEFSGEPISDIPEYHLGEFLLCSAGNIRKLYADFTVLWPRLLERFQKGQKKFNEEAHTLSYLYYTNGFRPAKHNPFMRRIWTNPLFYRDVKKSDEDLSIWHLPSEKRFGIENLYHLFRKLPSMGLRLPATEYKDILNKTMGIPCLTFKMKMAYYTTSYYRALKKRLVRQRA